MKGKLVFVATMLMLFITFNVERVSAEEEDPTQALHDLVEEQIDILKMDEIQVFWNEIVDEYGGFLPESQKGSLTDFLTGEKTFDVKEWFIGFIKYLLHELVLNGKLLGMILLLTIFSYILQSFQSAFEQHTVSKTAYAVTLLVLCMIAMNGFHSAMTYAIEAIDAMIHFSIALLPMLLALMASLGGLSSSALFHPVIIFLVHTSGILVKTFVLPMLFISAVLGIVSTFTDDYKVTRLSNLFRVLSLGLLGVFMTVFLGAVSVQGTTAAAADGLTLRAAKFIAGNFIPVVGRMFTDATDTVMSASLLLKNTIGMSGLIMLLAICAFPALKVLSIALIFQLSAAVLQPLGNGAIIDCLAIIGKAVLYIFAAMALIGFMFFLAITIMVAASNIAFMMR
ncbi:MULTISPECIES: stage III sporulation protein AE [Shouchella]|uniref:Stage III sporulation protein AE n=2 Tax=Shouchella TaxID=2893057 RepID=A0ABY7W4S9_9BACI|nr:MULTISPECIES: stage III sporulation protein AE [Shouchella]MED4127519.1 stage III sporulation protein AE [Shouchella miscanthi]WDF03962.1 stage III sporulation protein AE [Shouchella hunanensis]GAF22659.1 stage III sporulation protein AE [Bacillus sp. JCM 19047]